MAERTIVLASASPRRRELLGRIVPRFIVMPSGADETLEPGPIGEAIGRLAEAKAGAVAGVPHPSVIVAADTMVVIDGDALGKPIDAAEAASMLRRLRGRQHEVITGVTVAERPGPRSWTAVEVSRVVMARYPDALVDRYVASGAPLDKAGAYAIQDVDGALVDAIVGSYTNVIGLPLALTARLLAAADVPLSVRESS